MAGELESEAATTPQKSPPPTPSSDPVFRLESSSSGTTHTLNGTRSSIDDVERPPDEASFQRGGSSKYVSQNYRRAAGATYVLAMGVCGIVLVALASSLKDLAKQMGKTSIELGAVFLTRGLGAAVGNLVSYQLYKWVWGRIVVSVTLFFLAVALLTTPLVEDAASLHLNFFALGLLTAIINCGCQLMTRRLHGSAAGPWLGANTVAFGVSGTVSPLIGWITGSLVVEYAVLASAPFVIGFVLIVLPRPDFQPEPQEEPIQVDTLKIPDGYSKPLAFYEANKVDFHLCGILFWLMGGRLAATAFLVQFARDESYEKSPSYALLIVFLWLGISLGRIIGLRDQRTLTLPRLYNHAQLCCFGGMLAVAVLVLGYKFILWIPVLAYGVCNGPLLGYGYDLSTRISTNPETSSTVAMFGITAGASIVPFLTSCLWDVTGQPNFLPLIILASHAVPLALFHNLKNITGTAGVSNRRMALATAAAAAENDRGSSMTAMVAKTPTFGAPPSPSSYNNATDRRVSESYHHERGAEEKVRPSGAS